MLTFWFIHYTYSELRQVDYCAINTKSVNRIKIVEKGYSVASMSFSEVDFYSFESFIYISKHKILKGFILFYQTRYGRFETINEIIQLYTKYLYFCSL